MTEDILRYSIAEKINFLVLDLRDHYELDHGDFHDWDELTDGLYYFNCDINIEPIVEQLGGIVHPMAVRYGISMGITALQYNEESYYSIKHNEETNLPEMTYDDSLKIYDNMIESIARFVLDGK
jgi:hypothetical protein